MKRLHHLDETLWRVRRFLFRHFFLITAVWLVVVIVGVQWFAFATNCSDPSASTPSVFGSVPWVVPDFSAGP